jgi:crotonobetainyl-CoA:carnitine CoA-transferase CaiB-like acyl-CoA transferase
VTVGDGDEAVDLVRNPITFSDAEPRYTKPPPRLGEQSDALRAWLESPA